MSNAFEISTIVNIPPRFLLLWFRAEFNNSMLILHPFSDVKPFCLIFNTTPLLILPSIIEEKIRPKIGLIVMGRQFSTRLLGLFALGIRVVLFSFHAEGKIRTINKYIINFSHYDGQAGMVLSDLAVIHPVLQQLSFLFLPIFSPTSSAVIGGKILG